MGNLKKEDVYVVVDTPKKAKKLKKVLDIFGEGLNASDNNAIKTGSYNGSAKLYTEYNKVYFTGINWTFMPKCIGKTKVSIKQLRTILAKEHLKVGDYVVCEEGGDVAVGVFKEWECRFGFDIENCHYKDGATSDGGCFENFKRYATPEEIALLEPNEVDKFAELKEDHKNGAVIQFKNGGGTWEDCEGNSPCWYDSVEYRIKPAEKPKVGDVCKFWDWDENVYAVARLEVVRGNSSFPYASDTAVLYKNAKTITQQEAIDLLFKK